jgi:TolB-like protein/class 3 adenylate cyclase/Tfp pilus assembly protein PilF
MKLKETKTKFRNWLTYSMSSRKRLLAAIMFTDIVGYTAIMQENETAAMLIRKRHRSVFESDHKRCNGQILQYYGDGTLSIFQSAVEAVECAISMQQQFQIEQAVPLRIGIHLGDIVFDSAEIYGDGVNLASRIESLGIPGSILISEKLNAAIKSQESISTKSLGFFEFKNIKEAVEVFTVTNSGIRIIKRSEVRGKLKEKKKSIAVLPFVNMSSDPENEYFSDGITEEILNALVKVEGLKVTARTSSFMFKGKSTDVREIGAQLGVEHILEGSVRKVGNRVRVTAQLVSAVDGYHFFSENYDRTLEDIFDVQDEIASTITNLLREHLSEVEHDEQLVVAPTVNIEAYETYLQGLYYFNQFGNDQAMQKAIPHFQKAIDMAPDFGLPHARMAISYIFQAWGMGVTWEEAHRRSMTHIERLNELRVETAEAYFAQSVFAIFFKWNWADASKIVKKGLELFPNHASLYHCYSTLYYIKGDMAEAIRIHQLGLERDPLSLEMIFFMGIAYLWNDQLEPALTYLNKVVEMVPNHRTAWEYIGWAQGFQGKYNEAEAIFNRLDPPFGYRLQKPTCLGWIYFKQGHKAKAESCLSLLLEKEKESINLSIDLMTLYASFGDLDNAFKYLEKALRNKIGDSMMFRSDIFLKSLRSDPRFKEMEALIGEVPD